MQISIASDSGSAEALLAKTIVALAVLETTPAPLWGTTELNPIDLESGENAGGNENQSEIQTGCARSPKLEDISPPGVTLTAVIGRLGMGLGSMGAVATLLMLCASAAHATGGQTSVINGEEAAPGTFPYLAFVASNEGDCSGTVVSSNVILTAGHCVLSEEHKELLSPSEFGVITGNVDRKAASRTISTVSRVAVNPNFTYLEGNGVAVRGDVGVLGLSQPISAPPVPFATGKDFEAGTPVVMVGWGQTVANQVPPSTLHYGEAVVQSGSFCSSETVDFQSAWDLCALDYPYEEFSTCHGDSGGPLVMTAPGTSNQPLEIGVTSYGVASCSPSKPSYFARTDATAPWLEQKIKEYAPPPPPPAPTPQPAPVANKLPALTDSAAKRYTLQALREGLGGLFRGNRAYHASCIEVAESERKCRVSFYVNERDYRGAVTIYYTLEGSKLVWNDRFKIKAASNRCLYYGAHPSSCPTKIYRR